MKQFVNVGHVMVSAGFRPTALHCFGGEFVYEREARLIAAHNFSDGAINQLTLGVDATQPDACIELNRRVAGLGFLRRRAIIMGADTATPENYVGAVNTLVSNLELAELMGMLGAMALCQAWKPGEEPGKVYLSYEAALESATNVFCEALQRCSWVKKLWLEFLIPAEMHHFNTLPKALQLVRAINQRLDRKVVTLTVDVAHLFGGRAVTEHTQIFDELSAAAADVDYGHISPPLERNNVLRTINRLWFPYDEFMKRMVNDCGVRDFDGESFNPNDQDLGPLRAIVPEFRGEGGTGWSTVAEMNDWWYRRHEEFVNVARYIRGTIASLTAS